MINLTERDIAVDLIDYRIIDVLCDWLTKEKINLDDYIRNPEGHVNHNEYIVPDLEALSTRSFILGVVSNSLVIISGHKKDGTFTRTQHDEAIEDIPSIILSRLYDWMGKRMSDMDRMYSEYAGTAPNKEYIGLLSLDKPKFLEEYVMYEESIKGLEILIQYKKDKELAMMPPSEEPITEEPEYENGTSDMPPEEPVVEPDETPTEVEPQ